MEEVKKDLVYLIVVIFNYLRKEEEKKKKNVFVKIKGVF